MTSTNATSIHPRSLEINEFGCLLQDDDRFVGFQRPPLLNLAPQYVIQPSDCIHKGTLSTKKISTNQHQCICKLGYSGTMCQIQFIPGYYNFESPIAQGIKSLSGSTLPNDYLFPNDPVAFGVKNYGKKHLRFHFAYVDAVTNPSSPQYKLFNHDYFQYSSDQWANNHGGSQDFQESGYFETRMMSKRLDYHATLSPVSSVLASSAPIYDELVYPVNCVTLLAFEVDDDQLNISNVNLNTVTSYQPMLQITVVRDIEAISHHIPNYLTGIPPLPCPTGSKLLIDGKGVMRCGCHQGFNKKAQIFGKQCQYTFESKIDTYLQQWLSIPVADEFKWTISHRDEPQYRIQDIKMTIEASANAHPSINTYFASLQPPEIINGRVIYTSPSTPITRIFPTLINNFNWKSLRYTVQIDVSTTNEINSSVVIPALKFADVCTYAIHPFRCHSVNTAYCTGLPVTCHCKAGYSGDQCRVKVVVATQPTGLDSWTFGSSFLITLTQDPASSPLSGDALIDYQRQEFDSIKIQSSFSSTDPRTSMPVDPSELITTVELLGDVYPVNEVEHASRMYLIRLPPLPSWALLVDDERGDSSILDIEITTSSNSHPNSYKIQSYCNSYPITIPSMEGVAGCMPTYLECKKGWSGPLCEYNRGSFTPNALEMTDISQIGFRNQIGQDETIAVSMMMLPSNIGGSSYPLSHASLQVSLNLVNLLQNSLQKPLWAFYSTAKVQSTLKPTLWFNYPGRVRFAQVLGLETCRGIRDKIADGVIIPMRPQCHPINTRWCGLGGLIGPSIKTIYCVCNEGFIGPQCQTSFGVERNPNAASATTMLSFSPFQPLYYKPTHIIFSSVYNDLISPSTTILSTNRIPIPHSSIDPVMLSIPTQNPQAGVFVGIEYEDPFESTPDWLRSSISHNRFPAGLLQVNINSQRFNSFYCGSSGYPTQDPDDRSNIYCTCSEEYFGKRCELYLHSTELTSNGDYIPIKTYIPGHKIRLTLSSYLPHSVLDDNVIIPNIHITGTNYHFFDPTPMTLGQSIDFTVPELVDGLPLYVEIINNKWNNGKKIKIKFGISNHPCQRVSITFGGRTCPSNTKCYPSAKTFEEACPRTECYPGYYSLPGDTTPCINQLMPDLATFETPPMVTHDVAYLVKCGLRGNQPTGTIIHELFVTVSQPAMSSDSLVFLSSTGSDNLCAFSLPSSLAPEEALNLTFLESFSDSGGRDDSISSIIVYNVPYTASFNNYITNVLVPIYQVNAYPCHPSATIVRSPTTFDPSLSFSCRCTGTSYGPQCDVIVEKTISSDNFGSIITFDIKLSEDYINRYDFPVIRGSSHETFIFFDARLTQKEQKITFSQYATPTGLLYDIIFPTSSSTDVSYRLHSDSYIHESYVCNYEVPTCVDPGFATLACNSDRCLCAVGHYGDDCGLTYDPNLILNFNHALLSPVIIPLLRDGSLGYFFGQRLTPSLPNSFQSANINPSITCGSSTVQLTSLQPTQTLVIMDLCSDLEIKDTSSLTTQFIRLVGGISDSCEWLNNNLKQGSSACNLAGTSYCDLYDHFQPCICKTTIDDNIGIVTQWFGTYCNFYIKMSLGPFYIGQKVVIELSSNLSLDPNNIVNKLQLVSVSDSSHRFDVVIENQTIQSQDLITIIIPDTLVDTQSQPQLLTPSQIALLNRFKLIAISLVDEIIIDHPFRVVEPCYYTELARYHVACSGKKNSNGDYIAVSRCMDPDTHEIKCYCNPGYLFDECRFEVIWQTNTLPPMNNNNIHNYYVGQDIITDTIWERELYDYGVYGSPSSISFVLPLVNSVSPRIDFLAIPTSFSSTSLSIRSQEGATLHDFPAALLNGYSVQIQTSRNNARWNSAQDKKISQYFFKNPLITAPYKTPLIQGIEDHYGIICPGGVVTPSGCKCSQQGVFGPNCNIKINFKSFYPDDPPFRKIVNAIYQSDHTLSYTFTTPFPSLTQSPIGVNFGLPSVFHFEIAPRFISGDSWVEQNLVLKPAIDTNNNLIPNTIVFDLSKPISSYYSELKLISDDPSHPIKAYHVGQTYFVSVCPPEYSQDSFVGAYLPTLSYSPNAECQCKPHRVGLSCEFTHDFKPIRLAIDAQQHAPGDQQNKPKVQIDIDLNLFNDDSFATIKNTIDGAYFKAKPIAFAPTAALHYHQLDFLDGHFRYDGLLHDWDWNKMEYEIYFLLGQPLSSPLDNSIISTLKIYQPITVSLAKCQQPGVANCYPFGVISSLVDVDITFEQITDENDENQHFNQTPITITPPKPTITITIPNYTQYTSKSAQIKLHAYIGGAIQSTTLVSASITFLSTEDDEIVATLIPPQNAIFNKLFYTITFPRLSTNTLPIILTSSIFSTKAACYRPPTNILLHANPTAWEMKCGSHGTCSSSTQACTCSSTHQGELCDIPIDPCPLCSKDHTSSCISNDQCVCSTGWGGKHCTVESKCETQSDKKCNGDNGYLAPSTIPGKCSNTCICNNYWSGLTCQSCQLQCLNGGGPYRQCDKCGCESGFSGGNCECHGIQGNITINGYNSAMVQYYDLMSLLTEEGGVGLTDAQRDLFDSMGVAKNVVERTVNSITTSLLQLSSQSIIASIKTASSSPSLGLTKFPFDKTSTLMSFTITFGCDDYNPEMTKSILISRWNQLSTQLSLNEDFIALFTFPFNEIIIDPGDIIDIPATLPSDELNGADNAITSWSLFLILFLSYWLQ